MTTSVTVKFARLAGETTSGFVTRMLGRLAAMNITAPVDLAALLEDGFDETVELRFEDAPGEPAIMAIDELLPVGHA
jgi:hypothetical protein